MDDLKLCGKNERQLISLINTVHILKKKMGFTLCKAEKSLWGMKLQEK